MERVTVGEHGSGAREFTGLPVRYVLDGSAGPIVDGMTTATNVKRRIIA
jgi:hypothetical protein